MSHHLGGLINEPSHHWEFKLCSCTFRKTFSIVLSLAAFSRGCNTYYLNKCVIKIISRSTYCHYKVNNVSVSLQEYFKNGRKKKSAQSRP